MTRRIFAIGVAVIAIGGVGARRASAQDNDELTAITARVHGTFQDGAGGLGVVSGDMTIARFEVQNSSIRAIGRIIGAMADSGGNVLGRVNHDVVFAVANVSSTCNQLRIELVAAEAQILQRPVHFDQEVAGFDSREGATPKARPILCAAGNALRGKPGADIVVGALNDVVRTLATTAKQEKQQ
jgi:hypothetical protein